ncbi:hypothetical protein ABIB99_008950 [Bradyrhizobium sp. LA6.1]
MQMRSSAYWLLPWLAVAALAGLPTVAAADDADTCAKQSGDAAIAACSRAIASGEFSGEELAKIYSNRGGGYKSKSDLDSAIADYSEAIRVDPKHVTAYNKRGIAWAEKGAVERAVADYSEAIGSIRATSMPTTTAASFGRRRARSTALSPITMRQFGSIRTTSQATTTAATPGGPRSTSIAPSPTTIRRSALLRNMSKRTKTAGTLGLPRATSKVPSRTTTKRSCSIRNMPNPITTAALRGRGSAVY